MPVTSTSISFVVGMLNTLVDSGINIFSPISSGFAIFEVLSEANTIALKAVTPPPLPAGP